MRLLTNVLDKARRAITHSPVRHVLTRLGVVSMGRRIYNRQLIAAGTKVTRVAERDLVFKVTTDAEIRQLDGQHKEEELMARIVEAIRPGDHVADVGANIGMVSLLAAKSASTPGSVVVHAFEPEPRNAARLRENVALNSPADVRVHEFGLGDRACVHRLYAAGEAGDGTNSMMPSRAEGRHPIEIPIETLDAVVQAGKASQPNVLKIDVEGAEKLVLDGAAQTLGSHKLRDVFIELHPTLWEGSGASVDGFKDRMARAGFELVWERTRSHEVHQHYRRPE